jgi:glutamate synthase domain-containing protein 3
MKKVIVSLLFAFVLFLGTAPNVAAATENDIIATLEATNLPANYVQQAKNYLMSHDVTAAQADQIIAHINNAQAIVTASGSKSVNQLSDAERHAILAELSAAAAVLDMTVTVTSKEVTFSGADGTVMATFPTKGNDVKQTGSNNVYLAGGITLLVAAVGSAVVAKKRFYAPVEA